MASRPSTLAKLMTNAGYFFFMALALCVCLPKGAVNISGSLLLLVTILYLVFFYDRIDFRYRNRYVLIALFPFFMGFAASFFSLSGLNGAAAFLERYRFFVLILAFALFIDTEKKLNTLFILFNISALVSLVYGFSTMGDGNIWGVTIGFHTVGRGSDLLVSIAVMNAAGLFILKHKDKKRELFLKLAVLLNTVSMVAAIGIMGRRGSMLGLLFGIVIVMLLARRFILLIVAMAGILVALVATDHWILDRLRSISDADNNESRTVRLQLFHTGLDYIMDEGLFLRGTGAKAAKDPFAVYFNAKPDAYKSRFSKVKDYLGNFHNSFLQMAVEAGMVYVLLFLGSTLYLLSRQIRWFIRTPGNGRFYALAGISVTASCFLTQFFHNDLYMYGGIPYIIIFSGGCFMCPFENKNLQESLEPVKPVLYGADGPVFDKA
jgi:hypothetical protein